MGARLLPFDWSRLILYTHRWLGIAGGVLFIIWFLSGIVMMYARMPRLSPEERLMRQPTLDLSSAHVAAETASRLGLSQPLLIGILGERPVHRFVQDAKWTTIFADNAQPLQGLPADKAMRLMRP